MIDLHIHTNHSDGTDTVEQLLKNAENKKLEIISITDHDKIEAYYELEEKPEIRKYFSGKIIVGSELKTYWKDVPIEVLAYGIDYKSLKIEIDNEKMQNEILNKLKKVADNLGLVYDENETYIDLDNPSKQFASFTLGTEILKHEENKEIISKIGDFIPYTFYRIHQSNKNSPFYVNESFSLINIHEIINRIHEAGGLAFLAHGYEYPFENSNETIEEIISTTKIDGAECIYPTFSEKQREDILNICKKYNKYCSGGSDYHAKNKPKIELGTGINNNMRIEKRLIKDWIDLVKLI